MLPNQPLANTASPRKNTATPSDNFLIPPVDVIEDNNGISLYADLPGASKDKLSIQIDADQLSIEAELDLDVPLSIETSRAEIPLLRYRRLFSLSKELDQENIQADLNQGVLHVRIPKAAHAQPRKISVNIT